MIDFNEIINFVTYGVRHDVGSTEEIVAMLLMTLIMSIYEFLVYRVVSHKSMYNKSFHISIMVMPFFIGAIIMALQSNVVITLGTIGALAIIRFRTAVKDPVDMIYILWSVFTGIACGCQLYRLVLLTSVMVTLILVLINVFGFSLFKNPYVLVVNANQDIEQELTAIVKKYSKRFRLKSRNYTSNGVDYVYQVETKKVNELTSEVKAILNVKQFSLLEYDNDDVI